MDQLAEHRLDNSYEILFVVRGDVERFKSIDDFAESVTSDALRRFRWARISVGRGPLTVEVELGRRDHRPPDPLAWQRGVLVRITTHDPVLRETAESLRDSIAAVVARGSPRWGSERKTGHESDDLSRAVGELVTKRSKRITTALVLALLFTAVIVDNAVAGGADSTYISIGFGLFVPFLLVLAVRHDFPLPAIEISETTEGRRLLRAIVAPVTLGAITGLISSYLGKALGP